MYLYVRIDAWKNVDKKPKKHRRREMTRARSRPVLAGSGVATRVRHVQQSAHREVDIISM